MNFQHKRLKQAGIQSLGDKKRAGKVTGGLNPDLFVHGPQEFDCLVNRWSRQELLGLIGDSGVGKSEVVLDMFKHILQNNPDSAAIYVSLEMTDQKISERWYKMTKDDPELGDRLFIISRYDENGKSRNVSMKWIKAELNRYRESIGDVVVFAIDHIHCLGENDPSTLNSIMITLKEMAVEMNAFGIPMAQVNKGAGQKGEVPLDSDAVLACSQFKYICSDIIQIHRPILRLEEDAKLSVLGWGYCKVREADKKDAVKRGQNKLLMYDQDKRCLRNMTVAEDAVFRQFYTMLLEMKSDEEKKKAFTYDLKKEIVTKSGKVVTVTDKFSGISGDDF
jgi:ABC-type dipeptide/oligopeptide/nickel transport system ATPase component